MIIWSSLWLILVESIEYSGTVYVLDHKYPEPLIKHSLKKLQQLGIKKEDTANYSKLFQQ